MIKKLLFFISIVFLFSGCVLHNTLEDLLLDQQAASEEIEPVDLQALLRDNWEFYIYEEDKVILIKHTETGMLINDVFGVLDD